PLLALAGAIVALAFAPATAGAVDLTIDDWTQGSGALTVAGPPASMSDGDTGLSASNTIGGNRLTTVTKSTGAHPTFLSAEWNPPTGVIAMSTGAGPQGFTQVIYDGGTTAGPDPTPGLGAVNFLGTGTSVDLSGTGGQGGTINVRLYTDGTHYSDASTTV